jgi:tetratricopeptide (TPR) repeat protein
MMLLLLLFFASSLAQDSSELFTQANSLYQKNDCAAALKTYDLIPSKGAATWYNMGNCAYKLNDQIKALLYWKRAYKYGNTLIQHESITNMKKLSIPYGPLPHPYSNIPPLLMQILFFCIFGVFLIVGYFLIQAKRWIFLAMSFSVLVSAGRITHQVYSASQQALIMQETAVYAGPQSEYHQIRTVNAGTTVKLLKQNSGWSQISVDSMRGWIEDTHIEKI